MDSERWDRVPDEIRGALLRYKEGLRATFGDRVRKVALFGSWARGDARADSDIDVLVCIDGADWREEREAAAQVADVDLETNVWLSPAIYETARFERLIAIENPFARAVIGEEIVL